MQKRTVPGARVYINEPEQGKLLVQVFYVDAFGNEARIGNLSVEKACEAVRVYWHGNDQSPIRDCTFPKTILDQQDLQDRHLALAKVPENRSALHGNA